MAIPALNAAVTGAQVSQEKINVIANNIANVGSAGFKKLNVETADLFYQTLKRAGTIENAEASRRPVGVQIGYGAKVVGTNRNLTQGALRETGQPLDIAIRVAGYLAVTLPNGRIGYTRSGFLKKDSQTGLITTSEGQQLTNNITIPDNIPLSDLNISANGLITATNPDNSAEEIEVGQLELFNFPNEAGIANIGNGLYEESLGSGEPFQIENLTDAFKQGYLENSNVSAVEELTALISAQREYELNSRVIRVADEIEKETNNIK